MLIVILVSFNIFFKALTKKLIEKVKKEWEDNLEKKEQELEEEKKSILLQVSQMFKNRAILLSEERHSEEDDFLSKQ